jgi:single-stranded DNA-binding protein
MTNKHFYNYELITIKGNIGSDITLKTKQKERLEFQVAVNKYDKKTKITTAKWFKVVVFNQNIVDEIKNNTQTFKKGVNIEIQGEVVAENYKNKPILKIIARKVLLNIKS